MLKFRYLFYIIFVGIWFFFRNFPQWTEVIYSNGIYPYIAKTLHFLLGWVPFSVGDVFYTLILLFIVYFVVKNRKKIKKEPFWFLDRAIFFVFLLLFGFFGLWGFNYFRIPLEKSLKIDTKYTEEQLFDATRISIAQANELHQLLAENDSTKVDFTLSKREIISIASKTYPLKHNNISDFQTFKSVKSSLYSTLLTYMGFSGYLNPFTNEAQINGRITGYSAPVTACHEIAHQMGYAAEEEANFLGYISANSSENQYFRYSASLFALRYLLNEVHKTNPEKYQEFLPQIRKGIFKNYKEMRDFWSQYENKAEPFFKSSYDAFLKANKQKQGIQSYDLVVGLLIKLKITENIKKS